MRVNAHLMLLAALLLCLSAVRGETLADGGDDGSEECHHSFSYCTSSLSSCVSNDNYSEGQRRGWSSIYHPSLGMLACDMMSEIEGECDNSDAFKTGTVAMFMPEEEAVIMAEDGYKMKEVNLYVGNTYLPKDPEDPEEYTWNPQNFPYNQKFVVPVESTTIKPLNLTSCDGTFFVVHAEMCTSTIPDSIGGGDEDDGTGGGDEGEGTGGDGGSEGEGTGDGGDEGEGTGGDGGDEDDGADEVPETLPENCKEAYPAFVKCPGLMPQCFSAPNGLKVNGKYGWTNRIRRKDGGEFECGLYALKENLSEESADLCVISNSVKVGEVELIHRVRKAEVDVTVELTEPGISIVDAQIYSGLAKAPKNSDGTFNTDCDDFGTQIEYSPYKKIIGKVKNVPKNSKGSMNNWFIMRTTICVDDN